MAQTLGHSNEIDNNLLAILSNDPSATGPIHLGRLVDNDWNTFVSLAGLQEHADNPALTLRFGELYVTEISDDRDSAPIKTTDRYYSYQLDLYVTYAGIDSYAVIRDNVQSTMDVLQNNYRPSDSSGVHSTYINWIGPSDASIVITSIAGRHQVYRGTITFEVNERLSHD